MVEAHELVKARSTLHYHGAAVMSADVVEHTNDTLIVAKDQDGKAEDPQRLNVARLGKRGGKTDRHPAAREDALYLQLEIRLRCVGNIRKGAGHLDRRPQGRPVIRR